MVTKKEKRRGYFNALADASFKNNPEGEGWLYYPNGILSKGRVVKDEATKGKLFKFQKSMFMLLLPLGFFYGLIFVLTDMGGPALILPVIVLAVAYLWLHMQIKDLPKSKVKLKYKESTAKAMRGLPDWYSRFLFIISALVIILAVIMMILSNETFEKVSELTIALTGMGLFGIVLAVLVQKFRKKLDREYPPENPEENERKTNLPNESEEKSTRAVKPAYIVILILVVALLILVKVMNPNKKYSTREYWQTATIESVNEVPEETLKPGNKNGGVLMWAAMTTPDPEILSALIERGVDINEHDEFFSGTPLSGAAGYSEYPGIIRHLVSLGADINERVYGMHTVLQIAAMYNSNIGIIEELVALGANVDDINNEGETALDLAVKYENQIAIDALTRQIKTDEKKPH